MYQIIFKERYSIIIFNFKFIAINTSRSAKDFARNNLFLDICPGKAKDIDCSSTNELGIISLKEY
jgi:hypothetical protein